MNLTEILRWRNKAKRETAEDFTQDISNLYEPLGIFIIALIEELIKDKYNLKQLSENKELSPKNLGVEDVNISLDAQTKLKIKKEVERILKSKIYNQVLSRFWRNILTVNEANQALHALENNLKIPDKFFSKEKQAIANSVARELALPFNNAKLQRDIAFALKRGVIRGDSLSEIKTALLDEINIKNNPKYIAFNAVLMYEGEVNASIAREYDLTDYVYIGSIIETSRPQCKRWVGMKYLRGEDLESEINWAFRNGEGMNPRTNTRNFARLRGGYNCRHETYSTRFR